MVIVRVVLFLLGAGAYYMVYSYLSVLPGERARAEQLRSLEEDGIEVQARLVALTSAPGDHTASAVFALDVPGGDTVRQRKSVPLTPELRVGDPYPAIRHRQFPEHLWIGDRASLERSRRHHENAPRSALRWSAGAVAIGTLLVLTAVAV
ncbi:hypothetical protein [Streptomyces omiyaensis]|uniref:hypothetical protein n=1 Tax=Streptomyces omiyaensis TaxID=68247 RepID=UPI0036F909EA